MAFPRQTRQGMTCLNGLTTTDSKTPCVTYGSALIQASAAARDSNSATIRLPVKPALPGSSLSIAGNGPASVTRPFGLQRREAFDVGWPRLESSFETVGNVSTYYCVEHVMA